MKRTVFLSVVVLCGAAFSGCARISAQVVEKPRIDQALNGNRGYFTGSAPSGASAARKTTRQVVETNIEFPLAGELTPWKIQKGEQAAPAPAAAAKGLPVRMERGPVEPMETEEEEFLEEPAPPIQPELSTPEEAAASTVYTVRQGDTLEKIAEKVYGDGSKWRKIYNANQETLKSPNRIYPGQKLTIPTSDQMRKRMQEDTVAGAYK